MQLLTELNKIQTLLSSFTLILKIHIEECTGSLNLHKHFNSQLTIFLPQNDFFFFLLKKWFARTPIYITMNTAVLHSCKKKLKCKGRLRKWNKLSYSHYEYEYRNAAYERWSIYAVIWHSVTQCHLRNFQLPVQQDIKWSLQMPFW